MNMIGYDWITGVCFGIEFPKQAEEEYEEDGPMPWLVLHLGIVRIYVTKLEVES